MAISELQTYSIEKKLVQRTKSVFEGQFSDLPCFSAHDRVMPCSGNLLMVLEKTKRSRHVIWTLPPECTRNRKNKEGQGEWTYFNN